MAAENKNGMQCAEFDALLSDALDERLTGPKLESFQAHARVCPTCGPLLAEADAGLRWLDQLVEVEPPASLVQNILVATTGIDTVRCIEPLSPRFRGLTGLRLGRVRWSARSSRWRGSRVLPCHSEWHSSRCRFR